MINPKQNWLQAFFNGTQQNVVNFQALCLCKWTRHYLTQYKQWKHAPLVKNLQQNLWSDFITVLYIVATCIWLSAKRCACKGLCTSVENKTLLKTVFISNVVLCTCMNEWIYSTDNFSNQSSHTEKALKNDRQKWTSMYRVIFVTLLTNKSQAHGEPITDLYVENIVLYG